MRYQRVGLGLIGLLLCFETPCLAEDSSASAPASPSQPDISLEIPSDEKDFQNQETYIDVSDALRSKQYVHRAILNSLIKETDRFAVGRFYVSHMMGFSQVWQKGDDYSKFASGLQGISVGYVSTWGHALEIGAELSAVSNGFASYKYYIRPEKFSLWGFLGAGLGMELGNTGFAEGPPEAQRYSGARNMFFGTLGMLVPTIDVGFKAEVRICFYGGDRAIFISGVGLILFL